MTDPALDAGALSLNGIEAAIRAFREAGIDFASPRDGDLDDLEQERYNALCDAIRSYLSALPGHAADEGETKTPEAWKLEAAAIFMDHVDDDETGSVHRVAAFLRAVATRPTPAPQAGGAHGYATRLLVSLMEKHYPDRSPDWAPLPDLYGVLTQIDNLSTGLCRAPAPQGEDAELIARLRQGFLGLTRADLDEAVDRLAALSAEVAAAAAQIARNAEKQAVHIQMIVSVHERAERAETALAEKDRELKEAIELLNEVVPIADPSIQLRKFLAARAARQAGGDHER